MWTSARPSPGLETKSQPETSVFTSMMLEFFLQGLGEDNQARVLDLGPIRGRNIETMARWVKRLYVFDLFRHLDQELDLEREPEILWRHLDYDPGTFDAIVLWDLPDHLEDDELAELVRLCHLMAKPGGRMLVISQGDQNPEPDQCSFVIQEGYSLAAQFMPQLKLPFRIRQNRDMLSMMKPFSELRIFVYRDGMREFLFQKENEDPTALILEY